MAIGLMGHSDVQQIAGAVSMTANGVRSHLGVLEAAGLVAHIRVVDGPGRPVHRYFITDAGQRLLPKLDSDMLGALVAFLGSEDSELLNRFFASWTWSELVRNAEANALRHEARSFARSFEALKAAAEERAFFPTAEVHDSDDAATLTFNHCPVFVAAEFGPDLCLHERTAIERVMGDGVAVERTEHRLAGAPVCSYRLRVR